MSLPHITAPIWYAHEKFQTAVHALAASDAPIRERVREANRIITPVSSSDLPSDAAADLVAFRTRTGWAEDKTGKGTLPATLALISDVEARRLLQLVCDIDSSVTAELLRLARQP
jgi:hypothetical protein